MRIKTEKFGNQNLTNFYASALINIICTNQHLAQLFYEVDVLVQFEEEKASFEFYAKTPSTEKQTSKQIKKVQIQFFAV